MRLSKISYPVIHFGRKVQRTDLRDARSHWCGAIRNDNLAAVSGRRKSTDRRRLSCLWA